MSDSLKYDLRGVSADKKEVHEAIKSLDKGLFPKAFCKVLPDIVGGDKDYCNVMHADTAGTKTSLAYIYWKETKSSWNLQQLIIHVYRNALGEGFHRSYLWKGDVLIGVANLTFRWCKPRIKLGVRRCKSRTGIRSFG